MPDNVAIPDVRQNRSKLAPTSCQASSTIAPVPMAADVLIFFMALLSFVGFDTPSLTGSRRATPTSQFQQQPGHPLQEVREPSRLTNASPYLLTNPLVAQLPLPYKHLDLPSFLPFGLRPMV